MKRPPFDTKNPWKIVGDFTLQCDCGQVLQGDLWEEQGDPEVDLLFIGNTTICQCGANWLVTEGYQGSEAYRLRHLEKPNMVST